MKDPEVPGNKKVEAVVKMAILGFVFSYGLLLLGQLAVFLRKEGLLPDFLYGAVIMVSLFESIPAAIISSVLGLGPNTSAYLINPIVGAFIFGSCAAFWQFIVKREGKT